MQIGLEISYAPVFDPSALPESFNNLVYDRAGILFNLASLYSQLGAAEDRSTLLGLKQAIKLYQVRRPYQVSHDLPFIHSQLSRAQREL